jgi:hypothetical protein
LAIAQLGDGAVPNKTIEGEGGCLCGQVRYRVSGPLLGQGACHCRDCQYVSGGAPAYVIAVPKLALKVLGGTVSAYTNTAASGAARRRLFCANCGSPLFAEDSAYPDVVTIKVGSLDDRSWFKPQVHFWMSSAPPWHCVEPDAPSFPKGPPGTPAATDHARG